MPITIDALGAVTPLATVTIRSRISGQLQSVGFREGQEVKAGDFLAQIDPRPYQVALEQAQGTLAKDEAALAQAKADLARYQILTRQDSISRQQVEDQQFLVRQDQAATVADRAQVDNAKLNLAYCRIVSPLAGRIGLRQVDPGNYVQPTDANGLAVITQLRPISVIFSIPDELPQVMARLKAGAKLPVTIFDRNNTHQLATGVLDTIDNQIDTATGTVKLRASFANADESLFPNQFVNARVLVDTLTGVTLVPNAAVQRGAPGTFVYVVKPNKTVSVAPIKIGPSDALDTTVVSGLSPGQLLVTDGADRLSEGARVIVQNGPRPATTASPTAAPAARNRRPRR